MNSLDIPEVTIVQTDPNTVAVRWTEVPDAVDYELFFTPPFPPGNEDPLVTSALGSTATFAQGTNVTCTVRARGTGGVPGDWRSASLRVESWLPHRHLLVVPLPHGRIDGTDDGRLSVLLQPRLEMDGRLRHFREWRDWPSSLPGFTVEINGVAAPANTNLTPGSPRWLTPPPSLDLWHALFRTDAQFGSMPVERYRFYDQRSVDMASLYDGPAIVERLRTVLDRVARQHQTTPPTRDELTALSEFGQLAAHGGHTQYRQHMEPLAASDDEAAHRDPRSSDFHRVLGSLMAYPDLMRRIGLVVDLRVQLPPSSTQVDSVAVLAGYQGATDPFDDDDRAFWQLPANPNPPAGVRVRAIECRIRTSNSFWPAEATYDDDPVARSSEFFGLIKDDHVPVTFDIGRTVGQIEDLLGRVTGTGDPDGPDPDDPDPDEELAPGLPDDNGVHLVRRPASLLAEVNARSNAGFQSLQDMLGNAGPAASIKPIDIDARDVRLGWRYDVLDVTDAPAAIDGTWRSLFARRPLNGYRFDPAYGVPPYLSITDEAWMSFGGFAESAPHFAPGPYTPPGPPDPEFVRPPAIPVVTDLSAWRVSPVLLRWSGWSLAAPQPGAAYESGIGAVPPEPLDPADGGNLRMQVEFTVPQGTLPLLRYGRRYRFRARWVDLSGNSQALDAPVPKPEAVTDAVFFGRTTPVEPPVVARAEPRPVPGWGDTPETMVIRSELQQLPVGVEPTTRILVPPRTAQLRCEFHAYPGPNGLPASKTAFDDLVQRDRRSLDDVFVTDPDTGELLSPDPSMLRPAIPYLVDAAADAVAFAHLPGLDDPLAVPFSGSWPDVTATSVELAGGMTLGSALVTGGAGDPGLRITLPKGYTRVVEVSCALRDDVVEHFEVAESVRTQASVVPWSTRRVPILSGRHWMVSGRRELTLVHATRLPVTLPRIGGDVTVARQLDDSSVGLTFPLQFDRKSTDRVDVFARSTFPVDTPGAAGGVEERTVSDRIFELSFTYAETNLAPGSGGTFRSGTERRTVELTLEAFSRYSRYFTERHEVQLDPGQCWTAPAGFAEGSVVARDAAGQRLQVGTDISVDHAAGTVCVLAGSAAPPASPITIDYIPLPISRRSDQVIPPAIGSWTIVIPNVAVPDAVDVVEALPAFARLVSGDIADDGVLVHHSGAVIRLWIARPWFTTGEGERLAVVCTPRTGGESGADLADETRWSRLARDPLAAAGSPRALQPGDFVRADDTAEDVPLSDVDVAPGEQELVDVALHEVRFDDVRELWYVDVELNSDLESGPGLGYRPFVQLAVARYQPVSVDGAHIGPVTRIEAMRLGPVRETDVSLSSDGSTASVSVRGAAMRNGLGVGGLGHEVRAIIQRSDPAIGERALSWADAGDPVVLAHADFWSADVALPTDLDGDLRLVIEDAEVLNRQTAGPAGFANPIRNVVYIEVVDLRSSDPEPPPPPPDPPPSTTVTAAATGPTSVTVSWLVPTPPAGIVITGFGVQYQLGTGSWQNAGVATAEATSLVVADLEAGATYRFRVRVLTTSGPGPYASSSSVTLPPPEEPPDEPPPPPVASVSAVISASGVATVTWSALANPPAGLQYQVQYTRDGGAFVLAGITAATTLDVPGLQPGTYQFRVRPRVGSRTGPWITSDSVVYTGGAEVAPYDPVVPSRVLDTRVGIGVAAAGKIGADAVIEVQVAGRGGVPATGAGAVAINLTAVDSSQWTFVSAWPTGAARPQASVLNPPPGGVSTNFVVVPIGPNGTISLFNFAGEVHLLGDVMGWFPTGSSYGRVLPNRVLDTRNGEGVPTAGRVGPGETIDLQVAGRAGVPRSGAGAVAINLTAVNASAFTFLSAWPSGLPRPDASVLNPPPAAVVTNFLVVPIGANGAISIYNDTGEVHLLGDVMGWFPTDQTYGTVVPGRVLDTRSGIGTGAPGQVGPGSVVDLQVTGRGGIPATGVGAVAINLTAVNATEWTFVSAWPTGLARPDASVLNPSPGDVVTNFIVVPVGANGSISIYNDVGDVHLLGDVMGWFPAAR